MRFSSHIERIFSPITKAVIRLSAPSSKIRVSDGAFIKRKHSGQECSFAVPVAASDPVSANKAQKDGDYRNNQQHVNHRTCTVYKESKSPGDDENHGDGIEKTAHKR